VEPGIRATMRDVAQIADVSVSSVSNYTNGRLERLSPDTRTRIQKAITELGFKVNNSARSLRSSRTRTIGLLALDDSHRFLADPLTALYLAGLGDAAREKGYNLLVWTSGSKVNVEELLRPIAENRMDAACVILSGSKSVRRKVLRLLTGCDIPLVVLDELETLNASPVAHSVRADQTHGASSLVEHLIEHGHKNIAFIAAKAPWAVIEQRYEGFKRTLKMHSLDLNPKWTIFGGDWTPASAKPMIDKLLELRSSPTAIICGSDLLAIGAIRALSDRGIRVPDDIAVVGFDDFDVSQFVSPSLTTVQVPAWEMGYAAGEILTADLDISGQSRSSVVFPTDLLIRESS